MQLSKSGRAMLIYDLLEKEKKNLKFLGSSEGNVELMLKTVTEFKKYSINLEQLESVEETEADKYLKTKLQDIRKIYSLYEQKIKGSYIDEDDTLTILSKQLEKTPVFEDSLIYIDEFSGFTIQEYSVIKELMRQAESISVTMCVEPDEIAILTEPETDIFYYNKKTAKKLEETARELSVEVRQPILLKEQYRFRNEEIRHLEENIYSHLYKKYDDDLKNISLFLASNPYSEIEAACKNITKLVQEEGYNYSDIAVITGILEEMETIVETIFAKYDIPIFIDRKEELTGNILVKYILSIIDIFAKGWNLDTVFAYLKCGLYDDIDKKDIYKLENYCAKWGIRGTKWYNQDWEYDEEENFNELRIKIVEPLLKFKKGVEKKYVKEITAAIYMFLEENRIREKLNEKITYFMQRNEIYMAEEYKKSFDLLIELLDEIVLVFGDEKMSFSTYSSILKTGLKNSDLGKIPGYIDQVIIGDVDRSRTSKVRAVFIIGLNDGIFPGKPPAEGFLNDTDRTLLSEKGITLAKNTLDSLYEEQYGIYKVFSAAEEKLYVSYTSSNKEGAALRPSILISKLKRIFPKLKEQSDLTCKKIKPTVEVTKTDDISSLLQLPGPAFDLLLTNLKNFRDGEEIEPIWFKVYNWFSEEADDEWKEKLKRAIEGMAYDNSSGMLSKENIDKLYGATLKTSISKLEQYRKCPFSYYLKYGLKLQEKNEFKLNLLDTGSFMHEVIDEFFKRYAEGNYGSEACTEKEKRNTLNKDITTLVDNIIKEKLALTKNRMFTASPKFVVLTNRLKKVITKSIKYIVEQMQNSEFELIRK